MNNTNVIVGKRDKVRVLLAGAGNTIGSKLLEMLVARSDEFEITVFDFKRAHNMAVFNRYSDKIKVFYGDIADSKASEEAAKRQDFVIHNLSFLSYATKKRIQTMENVNVIGTSNLLNNLERFSPSAHLVYVSSISVYGDRLRSPMISVENPVAPALGDYDGISRIQAEKIVQESDLEWTILRPSFILSKRNLQINASIFNVPRQTRIEGIHIDDLCEAIINIYTHRNSLWGRIYNIGGGEECRMLYGTYVDKLFGLLGMKNVDIPPYTFASRNGIGGYYADGNILEDILHFRHHSISDYFEELSQARTLIKKMETKILGGVRLKGLISHSEPLKAHKSGDRAKMKYYF